MRGYDEIARIVYMHHERMDGRGYHDVKKQQYPLLARIISVADAYDAMTTTRPYREAVPRGEALVELDLYAGSQFDPVCVMALKWALLNPPPSTL